ncbi:nitronate monooxygenase [Variovorax ginsengisoli]|uniref:Nitronate monooxygenase n=1 Tax=Variovorax ginsengisoli TaxID=363844 RepID=A0ABT8SJA9_9BURK|nr:nitronate monooxygenase [Variovorax ginsengisoli]MDN8618466.1 nitronate monooxygenase [Variovorax ginsengisoli]MDO1537636.1 nitronate monooxygenase [Variovorax ginsengisoli]
MCQVGSADEARMAQQAGAQVVVAQGCEAGGHVRDRLPLIEVLLQVLDAVGVPVLAAGPFRRTRRGDRPVVGRAGRAAGNGPPRDQGVVRARFPQAGDR